MSSRLRKCPVRTNRQTVQKSFGTNIWNRKEKMNLEEYCWRYWKTHCCCNLSRLLSQTDIVMKKVVQPISSSCFRFYSSFVFYFVYLSLGWLCCLWCYGFTMLWFIIFTMVQYLSLTREFSVYGTGLPKVALGSQCCHAN